MSGHAWGIRDAARLSLLDVGASEVTLTLRGALLQVSASERKSAYAVLPPAPVIFISLYTSAAEAQKLESLDRRSLDTADSGLGLSTARCGGARRSCAEVSLCSSKSSS
ncbi:hypothetical protein FHG87_015115 [Trinorchestia longiramus]|nr:hypothetical protein FHG87_015115 [Trinorchestia longiramus]